MGIVLQKTGVTRLPRVLITGGMGYIGQNLAHFLRNKFVESIVIDHKNDKDLNEVEGYELVDEIDYIVHLAAISGIKDCSDNKIDAIKNNVIATDRVFGLATEHNIPVVFSSSCAVKSPFDSLYSVTKYLCEELAFSYNIKGGNIKVFRFTNIYGGSNYLERKNSVVKKFAMMKMNGYPLNIHGDGSQVRDFIHINDICRAIYLGLSHKALYSPIDIGTGIATSVLDLAKLFNCEFTLDHKDDNIRVNDPIADTRQAENLLGFKAKVKLEDGINEFI